MNPYDFIDEDELDYLVESYVNLKLQNLMESEEFLEEKYTAAQRAMKAGAMAFGGINKRTLTPMQVAKKTAFGIGKKKGVLRGRKQGAAAGLGLGLVGVGGTAGVNASKNKKAEQSRQMAANDSAARRKTIKGRLRGLMGEEA